MTQQNPKTVQEWEAYYDALAAAEARRARGELRRQEFMRWLLVWLRKFGDALVIALGIACAIKIVFGL